MGTNSSMGYDDIKQGRCAIEYRNMPSVTAGGLLGNVPNAPGG
jgi:hypothetical protein